MHRLAFAEADFDLGRVHVDVHAGRLKREEQRVGRMAVVVQHVAIGLAQRVLRGLVAHEAAVYVEVLGVATGLGVCGRGDEAAQRQRAGLAVQRDGGGDEVLAQQRGHAVLGALRRQPPRHLAVVAQQELHLRMRQRDALESGRAVRVLGVFALQEFAPRRGVEIQVHHFHAGAVRMGGRLHRMQGAVYRDDLVGVVGIVRAARQRQPRHGRHAGQTLAAEAQRGDRFQVVQRRDLAGGVAVQRQRQVVGGDAGAVVRHPDQLDAALGQVHADPRRAGVQAVFQHFLQRGGGAFHHLAGGDLVDEVVGQALDACHGRRRGNIKNERPRCGGLVDSTTDQPRVAARLWRQISISPGRKETKMMPKISSSRFLRTKGRLPKK